MSEELYTGAESVNDEEQKQAVAIVGAYGSQTEEGTVRFTLYSHAVKWEIEDNRLTVELSEEWAHQFAEKVMAAGIRLKYLRVLHHLGKLVDLSGDEADNDEELD